ncbi:MAG: MBL fold metallo-hydrolase [Candidatus Eisenbacteria sp.]|nr:MBL fold metallo-hydrolase [Candidatus Eisenbacteria bacterium]
MLLFRSLRSGSSGNLLLLENRRRGHDTRLLIDCGIRSQRACTKILEEEVGLTSRIDGLLITHAHSDHINYAALRVVDRLGIPIYVHEQTKRDVQYRYLNPYRIPASIDLSGLEFRTFGNHPFQIDGFDITPVAIPHAPGITTHAFVIRHGRRKLLIASDFNDPEAVIPHIYNCDLIYLEANHDLDMLQAHFNPASLYHMPNPLAGLLLQHAIEQSNTEPEAIILGHLSEERNRPDLAIETVTQILNEKVYEGSSHIVAAPRHAAMEPVIIEV